MSKCDLEIYERIFKEVGNTFLKSLQVFNTKKKLLVLSCIIAGKTNNFFFIDNSATSSRITIIRL